MHVDDDGGARACQALLGRYQSLVLWRPKLVYCPGAPQAHDTCRALECAEHDSNPLIFFHMRDGFNTYCGNGR